jgi:hypothetical protein
MKTNSLFSFGTYTLAIASMLLFTSCERDTPDPVSPGTARTFTPGEGFFILNEGGFTQGNSSVSYYAMNGTDAGSSFNNLYMQANGVPLGDVAQSVTMINGRMFAVINNSNKIVVLNPTNMGATTTITGFAGPRNIIQIDATTAWVTQMYSDQIAVLNLATSTVTGYINLGVTSEAALMTNSKVFVTSMESDKLYAVDPVTGYIDSSMLIAPGGNSMVVDSGNKLWVLAYGSWSTSTAGGLFRVNPDILNVEASMPFSTWDFPTHLTLSPAGDSLYYVNYDIYRMSTSDVSLPSSAFISGVGHAWYTIGMMGSSNNFFAGDAVDYVQSGLLFRYNASGVQTDVDTVGIIPNNFLWY